MKTILLKIRTYLNRAKLVKKPLNSVKNPVLRTRDHDYEGVING